MNILRKIAVALSAFILLAALVGLAWTHIIASTTLNRDVVKSWVKDSGFYNKATDLIIESTEKEAGEAGENAEIPINDPEIQAIARESFSPEFLESSLEEVLDGVYSWLEGDTEKPEYSIDISGPKEKLIAGLSNYAESRASTLPSCTAADMPTTDEVNALTATCLPPGVTPQMAGSELRQQLENSDEFFKDTQFTGEDLSFGPDGQEEDASISPEETEKAQSAFRFASSAPLIFGGIALITALAVVFLSANRLSGIKRAGGVFVSAGVTVGIGYLIFKTINRMIDDRVQDMAGDSSVAQEIGGNFAQAVYQDASNLLLWYTIGYIVFGVAVLLAAHFYKRGEGKGKSDENTPADPEPPTDDSPKNEAEPASTKTETKDKNTSEKPARKIQL